MALPEDLHQQFAAQSHIGLLLHPNARVVVTYYPDGQMLLTGDLRELPPLILFREQTILVSGDGTEWSDVTAEAEGMALYALLDPRRVFRAAVAIEEGVATVDLRQLLEGAGQEAGELPEQTRIVSFTVMEDGMVTEMTQGDIGQPETLVTVRFIPALDVTLPPL